MTSAALALLTADTPAVTKVTVYRSLLCGDDEDCPLGRLAHSRQPWGSVVLDFAGGWPAAQVNVVTEVATAGPGSTTAGWLAWIIN